MIVAALLGTEPAAGAAAATCRAAHLAVHTADGEVAVGNTAIAVVLRNTSHRACSLAGTPAVALLDARGQHIAIDLRRNRGSYLFGRVPARRVVLAPGASAFFLIGSNHVEGVPYRCATSRQIVIRPTASEPTSIRLAASITTCNQRRIDLSPIQPGLPNGVTSSAAHVPLTSRARRTA
jgi:hypothetical protein